MTETTNLSTLISITALYIVRRDDKTEKITVQYETRYFVFPEDKKDEEIMALVYHVAEATDQAFDAAGLLDVEVEIETADSHEFYDTRKLEKYDTRGLLK